MAGSTGVRLVALAVSLVTNILVSRELGPAGRGEYTLLLTLAAVVSVTVGLSGDQGVTERAASGDEARRSAVDAAFWGAVLVGLVAGAVSAVAVAGGAFGLDVGLWWACAALTMLVGCQLWYQRLLVIRGHVMASAAVALVEAVVFLLLTVLLVRTGEVSVASVSACFALALALGVALAGTILRPRLSAGWWTALLQVLMSGARYHPGQMALNLMMRIDVLMLGLLSTRAEVGIYSVGLVLTAPLGVVGTAIASSLVSGQVASSEATRRRSTMSLLRVTWWVTSASGMVLFVVAPWLIRWLWGEPFSGAASVTWVILVGAVLLAAQRPIGTYLVAQGMSRAMNRRAARGLFVSVVACLALVPSWDAHGAAAAAVLGYLAYTFESVRQFARVTEQSVPGVLRSVVRPTTSRRSADL